jgi:hypothetical protein
LNDARGEVVDVGWFQGGNDAKIGTIEPHVYAGNPANQESRGRGAALAKVVGECPNIRIS